MSRNALLPLKPRAPKPGRSAAGADLGGSSKYSNENFEGKRGKPAHPGNGSAGGRVQRLEEHRDAAWCPARPGALENRRTESAAHAWSHTHNRIRSPRQGKSAKWIPELGKRIGSGGLGTGSQSQPAGLSVDCSKLLPAGRELVAAAGRGRIGNAPLGPSPAPNSRLRTGTDKGNPDRLIKTKHCDGPRGCSRNVISAQCSECQSEEIQPSAGKRAGVTMTLLR
ncbi:hypothetical protein H6P81_015971 [Aristolochia fimbriata]|uniref:Uncharacterized protein n=1 Tax=Aristolochia fimbriata TaxID=158543 RepID=A0AAV7EA17_ARIFI|nr:hypothetical protein H6P81_015971 [Aristolochia fimbriata]